MIRITKVSKGQSFTLKFEGQLTGKTSAELAKAEELQDVHGRCLLDLSVLEFADEAGATFLRRLISDGAVVGRCSDFVRELLGLEYEHEDRCAHTETDLVKRLRAGEEAAFEELVRDFGGRMLSVARRFLGSEEDARDAVQDAFAAAFESIGRFNGESMLSTWLHRIVMNAALMQLRRRRRKPEHSIDELLPNFDAEGGWVDEQHRSSVASHVILEARETRAMVQRSIAMLPESYRTILILRDIEDLDTAETAERLGITPATVKVRLHRARQALRTLIERLTTAEAEVSSSRFTEIETAHAA